MTCSMKIAADAQRVFAVLEKKQADGADLAGKEMKALGMAKAIYHQTNRR